MLLMGLLIVCVSIMTMLRSSAKYGSRDYLRAPNLSARMEALFLPYEGRKPDEASSSICRATRSASWKTS